MNTLIAKNTNSSARSIMLFEANKRSIFISYLLWFFLGGFGGHRFYNQKIGSAVGMLALTLVGLILSTVGIGFIFLFMVGIWAIVDLFLIPKWVRNYNNILALQLTDG